MPQSSAEYLPFYGVLLEEEVEKVFAELAVPAEEKAAVVAFLTPLQTKCEETRFQYEHLLRVALVAYRIAGYLRLPRSQRKLLFYAGLLHDIGKLVISARVLGKTSGWTARDAALVKGHVMASYHMLHGRFDCTAEVVLWHHRFQKDGYPQKLPKSFARLSLGTKVMIAWCGRLLALADVYDALHRVNSYMGIGKDPTGEEIREKMAELNPDQRDLVADLYDAGIFTVNDANLINCEK